MKSMKSIMIGTGSVVLAGLVLTLVAPKVAHAVAATAVLVMNTTANPVPTQSVLPGKPFVQSCVTNSSSCTLSPPVPAGSTFVVQHVSATIKDSVATPTYPPLIAFSYYTESNYYYEYAATQTSASSQAGEYSLFSPTSWYVDQSTAITASADDYGDGNSGTLERVVATGYLTQ